MTSHYYPAGEPNYGTLMLRGTVAQEITFRVRHGRQEAYRYTVPSNPRTPAQQRWRGIFRGAIQWWHSLTPSEKGAYNTVARKRGTVTGMNFYVSEYLRRYR